MALDPAVEGETVTETELTELAAAMPTPSTGVSQPGKDGPRAEENETALQRREEKLSVPASSGCGMAGPTGA